MGRKACVSYVILHNVKKVTGKMHSPSLLTSAFLHHCSRKIQQESGKIIHSTLNKNGHLCQILCGMEATI